MIWLPNDGYHGQSPPCLIPQGCLAHKELPTGFQGLFLFIHPWGVTRIAVVNIPRMTASTGAVYPTGKGKKGGSWIKCPNDASHGLSQLRIWEYIYVSGNQRWQNSLSVIGNCVPKQWGDKLWVGPPPNLTQYIYQKGLKSLRSESLSVNSIMRWIPLISHVCTQEWQQSISIWSITTKIPP